MAKQPSLVAQRIQKIRKARKMSRQEFAAELGTSYLQVYRIEKGVTEISADDVPEFARALRCDVADLYSGRRAS